MFGREVKTILLATDMFEVYKGNIHGLPVLKKTVCVEIPLSQLKYAMDH